MVKQMKTETKDWLAFESDLSTSKNKDRKCTLKFFEEKLILNISTALLIISMGVMFYEASSRSILSESHWWAEELVRFLVVWSVLLSFGVASRNGNYIRMDLLYGMLPSKWQFFLSWLNCLGGLFFCAVLVVAGYEQVAHLEKIGMMTDSNLDTELWIVRSVLPISGLLYSVYFLRTACSLIKRQLPAEQ